MTVHDIAPVLRSTGRSHTVIWKETPNPEGTPLTPWLPVLGLNKQGVAWFLDDRADVGSRSVSTSYSTVNAAPVARGDPGCDGSNSG